MAVEPGAFRTRAYAGFADEPIKEDIPEYGDMLAQVRAAMIDRTVSRPAIRDVPTRGDHGYEPKPATPRLVLGSEGFDAAIATIQENLTDIRATRTLSRGADFADR